MAGAGPGSSCVARYAGRMFGHAGWMCVYRVHVVVVCRANVCVCARYILQSDPGSTCEVRRTHKAYRV